MEFKITTNDNERIAIIDVFEHGEQVVKYETLPFEDDSFKTVAHWTESDIKNFLRYESGSYYEVK